MEYHYHCNNGAIQHHIGAEISEMSVFGVSNSVFDHRMKATAACSQSVSGGILG